MLHEERRLQAGEVGVLKDGKDDRSLAAPSRRKSASVRCLPPLSVSMNTSKLASSAEGYSDMTRAPVGGRFARLAWLERDKAD
jgi:hypothetical protein